MAKLDIKDRCLVVTIEGMDKMLTLRSTITVPLGHVTGVTARPDVSDVMYMPAGVRFRGVHVPGHEVVGTIRMADGSGSVFCDFRNPQGTLAIDLRDHEFKRLILELSGETPEQARDRIFQAAGWVPNAGTANDPLADEPARIMVR